MSKRAEAAVLKAAQAILASRGGQARARKLSARRRSEIARQAGQAGARARWGTRSKRAAKRAAKGR